MRKKKNLQLKLRNLHLKLLVGKFLQFLDLKRFSSLSCSAPGEKLRAIDEELKLSSRPQPHNPASTISSYTVAVRKAEECAERRYRSSFEQWKDVELSKMRLEESKKMKDAVGDRDLILVLPEI